MQLTLKRLVLPVLLAAVPAHAADSVAASPAVQTTQTVTAGYLANRRLSEISGMSVSTRHDDIIWGVNDSGHSTEIFAFAANGADRGTVRLRGARNFDWEDMASFSVDGRSYLLIADTGDNRGRRSVSFLWVVEEPDPEPDGLFRGDVNVLTRITFRYEDGPHDCEAVAVDVKSRRILLVTKRDLPAGVYELPLQLTQTRNLVATRIASLTVLPRPTAKEMMASPFLGPWQYQPTALDIHASGERVALATYRGVYFFNKETGQTWEQAFAADAGIVRLPLSQTESVAFVGNRVLTVAEGVSAPLLLSEPPPD